MLRFSSVSAGRCGRAASGRDQTEWAIAAIPLGGYVKMLDEREGEVAPEELDRGLQPAKRWRKRFLIVLAGPVANFLFAIALYWVLFMHGVPEVKPVVGAPPAGTLAAARGPSRAATS